ncbi:DNA polymerase, beta domain protein region [Desulforamulus reducens MI-1]|uniref:DNA polymerase, beta domain protein region n=1 Tax=Desulforamulus reducens (strain ATCC BAA-1160 / DSM 100696 / MI-1) TaxID=349161 RepID=A4J2Y0_DESRM|nr:nucleotidyltransferase domain-containing protein [Desulforamulus reducens]ABO49433.1 DNA polymerase, beta domain protein region [Desulforamulus reducens MI-1]
MVEGKVIVKQSIAELISVLEKNIKINYVVLYGSHAKGSADKNSDIDIAVISPEFGKDPLNDSKIVYKLIMLSDIEPNFDVKTYSPEEFEKGDHFFVKEIRRTGKKIYPRDIKQNTKEEGYQLH